LPNPFRRHSSTDDKDRQMWRATLIEACCRTGWQIHAWALMGNHYHLLLETPEANLVNGMKWLQGTYTQRYNARHRKRGHLFQGRYRAIPVAADTAEYFQVVSNYIHLNPARGKLIRIGEQKLWEYPWSSYPAYVHKAKAAEEWLVTERVQGSVGLRPGDYQGYEAYMECRVLELGMKERRREMEARWQELRRGWYLGKEAFRLSLLERIKGVLSGHRSESYSGRAKREHGETQGELLLEKGLRALGLREQELGSMPKGKLEKQVLAWWLCGHTTVARRWVSDRLAMGHASRVTQVLRSVQQSRETCIVDWKKILCKITN
jgi:REP element-mobilizing transposase RayT